MKKQLLVLLCAFMVSGNAFADSLKGLFPVCDTLDLIEQVDTAIQNSDSKLLRALLKEGCVIPIKGTPISVLGDWKSFYRVRVYADNGELLRMNMKENVRNLKAGSSKSMNKLKII